MDELFLAQKLVELIRRLIVIYSHIHLGCTHFHSLFNEFILKRT